MERKKRYYLISKRRKSHVVVTKTGINQERHFQYTYRKQHATEKVIGKTSCKIAYIVLTDGEHHKGDELSKLKNRIGETTKAELAVNKFRLKRD